jgi:hypothetical protein
MIGKLTPKYNKLVMIIDRINKEVGNQLSVSFYQVLCELNSQVDSNANKRSKFNQGDLEKMGGDYIVSSPKIPRPKFMPCCVRN